jgi:hypothetical protein
MLSIWYGQNHNDRVISPCPLPHKLPGDLKSGSYTQPDYPEQDPNLGLYLSPSTHVKINRITIAKSWTDHPSKLSRTSRSHGTSSLSVTLPRRPREKRWRCTSPKPIMWRRNLEYRNHEIVCIQYFVGRSMTTYDGDVRDYARAGVN